MKVPYRRTEFDNGLKLVSAHLPAMSSVAVGIWAQVGGRYESKKRAGISHYLEHLLFKGTKTRSCMQIKQAIEGVGGSFNAFTGEEFTCYYVKARAKYLPLSFEILSDMVLHATLANEDVEKERGVILEEIKMEMDIPMHFVNELLNTLLWPNHPLGMELAGTAETVGKIRRSDLVCHRDDYYHPANLFVVAAGALRHEDLLRQARRFFLRFPAKSPSRFEKARVIPKGPVTKFQFKKTAQTHLSIGLHGLPRQHPDEYALGLLHVLLGANMSSRLFQEVRENRGLAYEIGTHLRRFTDTGAFLINAGVEASKTVEAISVILKELKKVARRSVPKAELDRAKEYFIGQTLLALEDTMDHMLWLGEPLVTLNRLYTVEEVLRSVKRVQAGDIRRVAHSIFSQEALHLAMIGPQKDKDRKKIEEVLHFD